MRPSKASFTQHNAVKVGPHCSMYHYFVPTYFFLNNNFIYLFICGSAGSLLMWGLFSNCGQRFSSCGVWASHCAGLSHCRAWAPGHAGCGCCRSWALTHRLSSCGSCDQLLCSIWDPPGPVIKPTFPALTGGLFTTEVLGKPPMCVFHSM